MLGTIHEFAREQLEIAGDTAALRRRHLQWCLSFAEQAVATLNTAEESAWLPRLRQEDANLQAALTWALASGHDADLELGLRLAGALAHYWLRCGRLSEARGWLTRVVNASANRELTDGRVHVLEGARLIEQAHEVGKPATPCDGDT